MLTKTRTALGRQASLGKAIKYNATLAMQYFCPLQSYIAIGTGKYIEVTSYTFNKSISVLHICEWFYIHDI